VSMRWTTRAILRRVLSVSYVQQATKLSDLYIRMPLSIGAANFREFYVHALR
jgi:hypothetical protein